MPSRSHRSFYRPPGIEEKVAFLSQAAHYAASPQHITVVETHMSWVFLTDRHAYKLKKPVRYPYLDFSTLEARRRDCEAEVRLNRRLTTNVYDDTVPLTVDAQGRMQLAGSGETVDWLVKMRRLPTDRMLDSMIAQGTVRDTDLHRVGVLLSTFYQQAPPVALTPPAYRQRLLDSVCDTRDALQAPLYTLPLPVVRSLAQALLETLEGAPHLFDQRVRAGKIIDAHGDLRPEHICLEDPPQIIDCLEFNRDFRILDTLSDLAFLSLECERLGAPHVGHLILEVYERTTNDRPPPRLLAFYQRYHALTRAKVAAWHLQEPGVRDAQHWIERAEHYLNLASHLTTFDN